MKFLFLFSVCFSLLACNKNCDEYVQPEACMDTAPTNEACQAFFQRVFYKDGECQTIAYSGCSQKGFETLEECEQCECNK